MKVLYIKVMLANINKNDEYKIIELIKWVYKKDMKINIYM
jgi:hypothetical protein